MERQTVYVIVSVERGRKSERSGWSNRGVMNGGIVVTYNGHLNNKR